MATLDSDDLTAISNLIDARLAAYGVATAAAVTDVDDRVQIISNVVSSGTFGNEAIKNTVNTLATASALSTLSGYVDTEVAAIKAKTDNLPSDPADASVIAGLIAAVQTEATLVRQILGNKHTVTDNGNGTYTIAVRNDADSATVRTITYNPVTGARTVS